MQLQSPLSICSRVATLLTGFDWVNLSASKLALATLGAATLLLAITTAGVASLLACLNWVNLASGELWLQVSSTMEIECEVSYRQFRHACLAVRPCGDRRALLVC